VSAIVNTFADAIVASDQVNSILLAAVTEVIEVVSDYRLDTIVQKAKGGSLASASEARLEGSCAGILAWYVIAMVCPQPLEPLLHLTQSACCERQFNSELLVRQSVAATL